MTNGPLSAMPPQAATALPADEPLQPSPGSRHRKFSQELPFSHCKIAFILTDAGV